MKFAFAFRLLLDFDGVKQAIRFKVNKPAALAGFSLFGPKNGDKVTYRGVLYYAEVRAEKKFGEI